MVVGHSLGENMACLGGSCAGDFLLKIALNMGK